MELVAFFGYTGLDGAGRGDTVSGSRRRAGGCGRGRLSFNSRADLDKLVETSRLRRGDAHVVVHPEVLALGAFSEFHSTSSWRVRPGYLLVKVSQVFPG
jgi:hypothetical protein